MYHEHWGFQRAAFGSRAEPSDYFPNPVHDEALARLHFLVDCRRRLGLLLGPAGSGRSFVLSVLAAEFDGRAARVARQSLLGLEPDELLAGLASGWGQTLESGCSNSTLWRAIGDRLAAHRVERAASVALLDDADEASPQVLAQVARLANDSSAAANGLTIVLSARTDSFVRLGKRLLEWADLRIDLDRWQPAETAGFVEHMLARAGRSGETFTAEALERLHLASEGLVRNVSHLAELALVAAAGRSLNRVDVHTIDTVYEELSVVAR